MATSVSVCSNASLMLGGGTINDLDENTDRAKIAKNLYPQIRDAVLRAHPWNCNVKRVLLAPDVTAPEFDYGMRFALPDDWARTLQVGYYGQEVDHRSEGRFILCDTNPLPLRYASLNTVEATWDTMLVHGVSLAMAAAMAYPITKSTSLGEAKLNELMIFMKSARAVDGQDDPAETLGDFRYFMSRKISRV